MTHILSNPTLLKAGLALLGLAATGIAWLYLAGFMFLEVSGFNGSDVTYATMYEYWYYYGDNKATHAWLVITSVVATTFILLPFIALLIPRKKKLYGDARFATEHEIKKAGLFADDGIVLGKKNGKYIIFSGTQHVLMAAPTRGRKGVSVVIPNLLAWDGSVVVLDVKDENWDITAGYRQAHGHKCYRLNFAPTNYKTNRYNPLHYISGDPNIRINDIIKIGRMLFPDIANESPIWQASSRSLWLGTVLYLLETDNLPVTLGEVLRQISMGDKRLEKILKERTKSNKPLSTTCNLALKDYLETTEKTRSAVKRTFVSALEVFFNPLVDAATSENDFDIRDLRRERISVYLCIKVNSIDTVKNIINLFYQQVIDLNTEELPQQNPDLKHQLLILGDEFTSVGRLNILSKGISFVAGYGIRLLTIIQSMHQLTGVYQQHDSQNMVENHAVRILFKPKDFPIAKDISNNLGNITVVKKSKSKQFNFSRTTHSESINEEARALLLPQEILDLDIKDEIIISENCNPILCDKITWYNDPIFRTRGNDLELKKFPYPSPESPAININDIPKGEIEIFQEKILTAKDIKNTPLENIGNIASVKIPEGDLDDAKLAELVQDLRNAMS